MLLGKKTTNIEDIIMNHEIIETSLTIEDIDISFDQIYGKKYIPKKYIEDIKKANFLIIPEENFRGEETLVFPETTRDFFEYVKESSSDAIMPDIAISDEDFQRVELHSAAITVATVIVQWIVVPVATSLIASFLYDLIKKQRRKDNETTAEVNMIVEDKKSKKSKKITYKGPVSGVEEALNSATKNLFKEE